MSYTYSEGQESPKKRENIELFICKSGEVKKLLVSTLTISLGKDNQLQIVREPVKAV